MTWIINRAIQFSILLTRLCYMIQSTEYKKLDFYYLICYTFSILFNRYTILKMPDPQNRAEPVFIHPRLLSWVSAFKWKLKKHICLTQYLRQF